MSQFIDKYSVSKSSLSLLSIINGASDIISDTLNFDENDYHKKDSTILPTENGLYNIGSNTYKYNTLYLSETLFTNRIESNNILSITSTDIDIVTTTTNIYNKADIEGIVGTETGTILSNIPSEIPQKHQVEISRNGDSFTISKSGLTYYVKGTASNGSIRQTVFSDSTIGLYYDIICLVNSQINRGQYINVDGSKTLTIFIQNRDNSDILVRDSISSAGIYVKNYKSGDKISVILYDTGKYLYTGTVKDISNITIL